MARRSDHNKTELKQLILDTGWNIVKNEGYSALTARRLAKEIGYTQGTIYNIFTSMDDLYLHLNGIALDILYEILSDKNLFLENVPISQNMKNMAIAYQNYAVDYRNHWLMMFTYTSPQSPNLPEWYQEKITRLFLPMAELLRSSPLFKKYSDDEIQLITRTLWASVHGIVFLENTGRLDAISIQKEACTMIGILIDNFVQNNSNNE